MITEYRIARNVCSKYIMRFVLKSEFCEFSISNEDGPEECRDPLLGHGLMEYSESLDPHPRSQSIQRRAQYNSFPELPLVICSPAKVQLAIGQTVFEQPIKSVMESAIFDDTFRSPK